MSKDTLIAKYETLPVVAQKQVEDIEDARTMERAKSAHGKKPRIPWSQVKKEAGLD